MVGRFGVGWTVWMGWGYESNGSNGSDGKEKNLKFEI